MDFGKVRVPTSTYSQFTDFIPAVSAYTHEALADSIVLRTGFAVVLPEYTLAPEEQFPVQHEQCFEVIEAVVKDGPERSLKTDEFGIIGDSAGGLLYSLFPGRIYI